MSGFTKFRIYNLLFFKENFLYYYLCAMILKLLLYEKKNKEKHEFLYLWKLLDCFTRCAKKVRTCKRALNGNLFMIINSETGYSVFNLFPPFFFLQSFTFLYIFWSPSLGKLSIKVSYAKTYSGSIKLLQTRESFVSISATIENSGNFKCCENLLHRSEVSEDVDTLAELWKRGTFAELFTCA